MPTKMLYDNLTNFAGYGVEDPRADKILPWAWSKKSADSPAEIKFVGNWRRSMGVDMVSQDAPNLVGGPLRANFGASDDATSEGVRNGDFWWIHSSSESRLGDTGVEQKDTEVELVDASVESI